ncbi:TPA: BppU family phage baseplate upper protein [Bacillus toyonensis]|nr:BppU family phage baseplate upper protein [Bacillus toyonensis]
MNQIIEMTVDIQDGITHSYKEFSQNNLNNSELILNIADGGKEFLLEEKDKIIVYFQKPDKQFVFQDKDIVVLDKTKGKIKVLLTAQTIVVPGTVHGEISIERVEDGVKKRTSTYSFTFRVRSSLALNEVIESTNEFGPLQKGIEVGEKFKDVDFDPIIAAGELAKGALPKTGGTLTGNLKLPRLDTTDQTPAIFNGNSLNRSWKWDLSGDNLSITPTNVGSAGWDSSKTVVIQNLLKKTGDTMSGTLNMTNSTVNWEHMFTNNGGRRTRMFMDNGNGTAFTIATEKTAGKGDWDFNEHLRVGDRRNWLKNSSDTMTGHLNMSSNSQINYNQLTTTSSAKGFMYTDDASSNIMGGIGRFRNTTGESYYMGWGAQPWSGATSLTVSAAQFTYKNARIMTAEKDGDVVLTLINGATNPDTSIPPRSYRRGNTVMIKGAIRRAAGSSTSVVTTLPADMRPLVDINTFATATDGTQVNIYIGASTGNVTFNVMDKTVMLVQTYLVN